MDPDYFDTDTYPDPTFHFDMDVDPDPYCFKVVIYLKRYFKKS